MSTLRVNVRHVFRSEILTTPIEILTKINDNRYCKGVNCIVSCKRMCDLRSQRDIHSGIQPTRVLLLFNPVCQITDCTYNNTRVFSKPLLVQPRYTRTLHCTTVHSNSTQVSRVQQCNAISAFENIERSCCPQMYQ